MKTVNGQRWITQSHVNCKISQGHSHFVIIWFWVKLQILVWKMHLLTLWASPLNPQTVPLLGYPKVIPYTVPSVWTLWIIRFWVMLQTNRRTDLKLLPTPTYIVGVGNNRTLATNVGVWHWTISESNRWSAVRCRGNWSKSHCWSSSSLWWNDCSSAGQWSLSLGIFQSLLSQLMSAIVDDYCSGYCGIDQRYHQTYG